MSLADIDLLGLIRAVRAPLAREAVLLLDVETCRPLTSPGQEHACSLKSRAEPLSPVTRWFYPGGGLDPKAAGRVRTMPDHFRSGKHQSGFVCQDLPSPEGEHIACETKAPATNNAPIIAKNTRVFPISFIVASFGAPREG